MEEDERSIEDAVITTPSKNIKRQNVSKTPVRVKMTPKLPHNSVDSLLTPLSQSRLGAPAVSSNLVPTRSGTRYMNPNNHKITNESSYNVERADNLLEPPPPPPVTPTQLGRLQLPTSPEKHADESLIIRGMAPTKERVEVSQGSVDDEGLFPYAGICILVLVILLALVSGLWSFDRMNSQITIGALRQDLQNYRALQSQEKKQDEYYVKELETEMRVWRQEAKAKHVELEALRVECQLSKESA